MGVSERNHHVDIFHQFWENSGCSIPIAKDDLVSFFPAILACWETLSIIQFYWMVLIWIQMEFLKELFFVVDSSWKCPFKKILQLKSIQNYPACKDFILSSLCLDLYGFPWRMFQDIRQQNHSDRFEQYFKINLNGNSRDIWGYLKQST